jgi:type I restriction enzyme M protein
MLDAETKRRIDAARDILVGKVPDPKSQVEQITIALIYKFMDDMDKESVAMGGKAQFFTGEYERYGWSKVFGPRIGGFEMINLYGEAIVKLNQNPLLPQLFRDIFKNAYLPYRDPETLKLFLKTINEFSYDHSEKLGDAFEYLLSVLGSQGDAGQFRTPRHIIDFMVEVVDPQKNETIIDPACGTAGFLISSYKHIIKANTKKQRGDLLSAAELRTLLGNFKGYDISPDMVRLSLVNLYLHGFVQPKIYEYDTLTSEDRWNEYADVCLANPPFMSPTGGIKPHKRFSVQSKRSEVLFVDYIAEHLTPTGRAAVIVPEGIIFQGAGAYKQLRKMLVEHHLYAVVSLPGGVFNPYSGVKTSILFLNRQVAKKRDGVLFIKIENDGFSLGAQRREIDKNDLPEAARILREWKNSPQITQMNADNVLVVPKEKLAENGEYNLTGDRYRIPDVCGKQKWPMVRLGDGIFLEIKNGKNVEQFDEVGKYRVSRIQTISDGRVDLHKIKWTNDNVKENELLKEGDILFSHINSLDHLAKTALFTNINEQVVHGVNLICLRPDINQISPTFIIRIFKSNQFILTARTFAQKAVNQASIKVSDIKNISIPLPPLEVQQEIVAAIEGYQKVIDGARQVIDNWKPQIDVNPDWPMVRLGDVCEVIAGQSPAGRYYNERGAGTPFYQGKTEFTEKYIGLPVKWTTQETKIAEKDDILISVRAPVGPINISTQRICIGRGLAAIRPSVKILLPFLFALLKMQEKTIKGNGGAVFDSISKEGIEAIKIPLPPLEVQQEIVAEIEAEQKVIDGCRELIVRYEENIKRVIDGVWGA